MQSIFGYHILRHIRPAKIQGQGKRALNLRCTSCRFSMYLFDVNFNNRITENQAHPPPIAFEIIKLRI
jgi:hypothetical protein